MEGMGPPAPSCPRSLSLCPSMLDKTSAQRSWLIHFIFSLNSYAFFSVVVYESGILSSRYLNFYITKPSSLISKGRKKDQAHCCFFPTPPFSVFRFMGFSRELSAPPQVSLPHAFGVIIRRGGKGEKGRHQLSGRKEKEGVGKGDPLFSHWGEKRRVLT